jgi:hypothetical protein
MGAQGGEAQSGFAPGGLELEVAVLVMDAVVEDEKDEDDVVAEVVGCEVDVLLV